MSPKEAVLAVTYRCNARCSMCNIWRQECHDELEPFEYSKLPGSLRTVNVTGGEPFLRSDLADVVQAMSNASPKARIVFSTNGLLTNKIVDTLMEIRTFHPRLGVGVSIDGRSEVHDHIRGVHGIFGKAMATIDALKNERFGDLRIGMTITPNNTSEIQHVYAISRSLGVEFTITVAHNSEIYFGKTDNIGLSSDLNYAEPLKEVAKAQLRSDSMKDWYRAYHTSGLFNSSLRRGLESSCRAGTGYFFMTPNGDLYPCNVLDFKIGNLKEVSKLNELLAGTNRKSIENAVRNCRNECWMVCNTRNLIKTHPIRVSAWVLKNKLGFSSAGRGSGN